MWFKPYKWVISPLIWVISIVTLLITLLLTTHEPPSNEGVLSSLRQHSQLGIQLRLCTVDNLADSLQGIPPKHLNQTLSALIYPDHSGRSFVVNPRKLEHSFRMIHAGIPYTLL